MSRQSAGRGNGRSNNGGAVARGAGYAAAKGAGLIGVAVIIGIVLLNVVDDGSKSNPEPAAAATTTAPTTTKPAATTTTTTTDKVPAKTPAELTVLVLNAGAAQGSARTMSQNLKLQDYTNQLPPADWTNHEQTGNVVLCKAGLTQEAAALATAVGSGTPVGAFPNPAPPGSANADCVVVVGKSG